MKKKLTTTIFVILTITAFSQKKSLTNTQYFKNDFSGIIANMPQSPVWLDDNRFVMTKNGKKIIIDAKTGKEENVPQGQILPTQDQLPNAYLRGNDLYIKETDVEIQLTNDSAKEINPTMSPDNKYVAYTKKNNLYSLEIATKKETQLTNDGTDLILNGYASWVYMEEILGRASQYRSFWWSPDSKKIAFFRSDDSKVPTYTITDAPGQHGYVDVIRYPKVGDTNPEVKVGMVDATGGNIVWADFNEHDDQYFGLPYWKPDSKTLLVQWMNRKQNQLKIYEVDPATGSKKTFLIEEQKTWVSFWPWRAPAKGL